MRRGRRILEELDRDIREHIERETQDNIERGMTPEEARYAAVRKFGNVMRVKEDTRDVWRIAWIEELWQDIRYGLRMLRNSPGFAAVAVLTLALGIGANTAIFSLIDAVMLRSLPVEKPSELVVLRWSARKAPRINGYMSSGDCPSNLRFGAANPSGCSFSEPMFREIRNTNQFSGVAAFANAGPLALTGNGPASMISGQLVSGDFFNTLGLRAAAGRVLELSDDSPTAAPVAVLNYGHWQSSFGGARDAVGRTIELNGVAFTIVGVVEQRFTGITPGSDYDVWLPLAAGLRISDPRMWDNRQDKVTFWWLTILGRLKAERPILQAQAAISGIFRNEMLHGSIPLFEAGGMPGPPEPRGGGGPASRQVVIGGPAPAGARAVPPPPVGGSQSSVVVGGGMPPAAGGQGSARVPAPSAPVAQGQAPPDTPNEPRTFSKPDDEPTVTLVNAQTGLTGSRGRFANPLYVLMFAVGIILLIICSYVHRGARPSDRLRKYRESIVGASWITPEGNRGAAGARGGANANRAPALDGKPAFGSDWRHFGNRFCVVGLACDRFFRIEQSAAAADVCNGARSSRAGVHRCRFSSYRSPVRPCASFSQRTCGCNSCIEGRIQRFDENFPGRREKV